MEKEQKHYYAFISHSSSDAKVAKWLCRQLEGYYIPIMIQKEYHAPKHLKPIFIYQKDLSGNILRDALGGELSDSQYLIVICSPAASKSYNVNKEVIHFLETGRGRKIIPFIVDGTPFASLQGDRENECFPPALVALKDSDLELRGIDLREEKKQRGSKKAAIVDIIATMLGVRYDTLWDRYRIRRIRQYCIAALLALLLCLTCLFVWDYYRPTYSYYADYVDQWGAPKGIIELDKEQQHRRHRMYRFEQHRVPFGEPGFYHTWRVTEVRYVNNRGVVFPHQHTEMLDRFPIQEISYNKQTGHVEKVTYRDEYGRIIIKHLLSDMGNKRAVKVDFASAHEQQGDGFISAYSNNLHLQTMMSLGQNVQNTMSSIKRYIYERNDEGYITAISYRKNNDDDIAISAACDADGVYGIQRTLDSLGRCVKLMYLDKDARPMSRRKGIASKEYQYNQYGQIAVTRNLDLNGNLVFNEQGWAKGECVYNEDGNCYMQKYYDVSDRLAKNLYGRAQEVFIYDNECNIVLANILDSNGNPCFDNYGYFQIATVYDKLGRIVCIRNLNSEGKLHCDNVTGTAYSYTTYDEKNRPVSLSYYGVDGQKACCRKGFARVEVTYDGYNISSRSYFDANGMLCLNREILVAKQTFEYDEQDYLIRLSNYNTNNELCVVYNGAVECRKYLPNGNIEEVYFLNEQEERFNNANGFNKMRMRYSNSGWVTETCYYDKDDHLCMNSQGFAIQRAEYEETENGMICKYSVYDTLDRPCMQNIMNVSKLVFIYDKHANLISQACFDTINQPCMTKDQLCSKCENQFDEYGHLIQSNYYNYVDGEYVPCRNYENLAIMRKKYDERGYLIESSSYDENDTPTFCIYGFSKFKAKYDDRGRCTEMRFYIEDSVLYNNAEGVAMTQWEYDDKGDCTKMLLYDDHEQLCNNIYGVAYSTYEYNIFRGIEKIYFYNKEHQLTTNTLPNFNCASVQYEYDAMGNVIAQYKYDEDGELIE